MVRVPVARVVRRRCAGQRADAPRGGSAWSDITFAHRVGVTDAVEEDEPLDPVDVRMVGAAR